jgi:hypothetical protein
LESNRSNNWPDIPERTKVFAYEYSIAGNFRAACKRVGIGREHGLRLLRDPLVDEFLADLRRDLAETTIITREFLELEYLTTLEQMNGDVDVANVTKDGDVVMAPRFNGTGKVAVLRDMAKFIGVAEADKSGHGGVNVQINMGDFTGNQPEVEVKTVE